MHEDGSSYTLAPRAAETGLGGLIREIRRPTHWFELARFGAVGASGYAINLAVFTGAVSARIDYRAAATIAFCVALVNNFVWNRLWTFRGTAGRGSSQALRFVLVSVAAFLASLVVLDALVRFAGAPKLVAEAVAVLAMTPLSFLANKLWSFRPAQG